jgi:hypothetical protein
MKLMKNINKKACKNKKYNKKNEKKNKEMVASVTRFWYMHRITV